MIYFIWIGIYDVKVVKNYLINVHSSHLTAFTIGGIQC